MRSLYLRIYLTLVLLLLVFGFGSTWLFLLAGPPLDLFASVIRGDGVGRVGRGPQRLFIKCISMQRLPC